MIGVKKISIRVETEAIEARMEEPSDKESSSHGIITIDKPIAIDADRFVKNNIVSFIVNVSQ